MKVWEWKPSRNLRVQVREHDNGTLSLSLVASGIKPSARSSTRMSRQLLEIDKLVGLLVPHGHARIAPKLIVRLYTKPNSRQRRIIASESLKPRHARHQAP